MNFCCLQDENKEANFEYEPSDFLLYNRPALSPSEIPQLKITLDLPNDSGYLATYWPGQKITGQLSVRLNQPIKIYHFNIVLFGHVQVYDDSPGQPLTNGIFDHCLNEQLTYTGVRVKNDRLETDPIYPIIDNKAKKSQHDRHIESLVKKVATLDHSIKGDNHLPLIYYPTQCDHPEHTFELTEKTYSLKFSIRVPSRVVHSMDHPHFPITYRVVAFMHGQNLEHDVICYSTKKIRIESFLQPIPFTANTEPTYQYIHQHKSWSQSMYTRVLSQSHHLSQWMARQSRIAPTCYLKAHAKTVETTIERGHSLPLTIVLENHAHESFRILVVRAHIELVKRIRLTCSLNEQIEQDTISNHHIELKNETHHATLVLQMPRIVQIPKHCLCSIGPKSTRDAVAVEYTVDIQLTVIGDSSKSRNTEPHEIYLDHHHSVPSEMDNQNSSNSYTWQLNPVPIFIGNKKLAL